MIVAGNPKFLSNLHVNQVPNSDTCDQIIMMQYHFKGLLQLCSKICDLFATQHRQLIVGKFWLGLKSGLGYNEIRYGLSFNYYCFQPGYHEPTLEMLFHVCTCHN